MQSRFFLTFTLLAFFALDISVANAFTQNNRRGPKDPANVGPVGLQLKYKSPNWDAADVTASPIEITLKPLTETGTRALDWLNLVNKNRAPEQKLVLADRNTKNPVPPDAPKINSVKVMLKTYQERIDKLPVEMKKVLVENAALSESTLVTDEVFITYIREINSSYQNAVRWIGQQPWLSYYEQNAQYDIRGLYFINRDENFKSDMLNFMTLETERKELLTTWLLGLCLNRTADRVACDAEFAKIATSQHAANFYVKYIANAQKTYANFFTLNDVRKELKWNTQRTVITQDFILPSIAAIANWLKTNVEEEWKALNFQLLVNYVPQNFTTPFIEFEAGVTPNVSGNTWNKITMDPNYSLDDFSTQWTIRHEFGHVLGFPDCYLEFYEPATEEMIYYTIEPDNLMCAWGGVLQPSHVQEMKRVY